MGTAYIMNPTNITQTQQHVTVRPIQQKAQYVVRPNEPSHSIGSGMFHIRIKKLRIFICLSLGPSSPNYQHSPSNSHCSSNHNPPSIQSNPITGGVVYDKISNSNNNNNENSDNQRALLLTSKPNLRSFTVPVAPPIIPPPPITNKQQAAVISPSSQCNFNFNFLIFIIINLIFI